MLNQFRIFSSLIQNISLSGNVLARTYARARSRPTQTVKPLAITNRRRGGRDDGDEILDFSKMDREVYEAVTNVNVDLEPSLAHVGEEYDRYQSEKEFLRKKIRRKKLFYKHFKELDPREVSVITYAEKEQIRFLHESNPDRWTPEALAEAFPISVRGAEKLLQSSFRLRRPEDVAAHDEKVKERLERIKAGEISLTPELQRKMAIREKILFKVGELPPSVKELAIAAKPKPLGEFAKLVAKPERIRENQEQVARAEQEELEASRKSLSFAQQMREKGVHAGRHLTLAEFEEKVKSSSGSPKQITSSAHGQAHDDHVPEVQYLLRLKESQKVKPVEVSEMMKETEKEPPKPHSRIQKFKSKDLDEDELVPVNVEDGVAYIYDSKTGYQKPYASSKDTENRIQVPRGKRTPGKTYQVGDSFYDEDGEFLYRVV